MKKSRKIPAFQTVRRIERRTGKKVFRVELQETIYVLAKNQRECDEIVCRSSHRWIRYQSSEKVKDKSYKVFGGVLT